MNPQPQPQPDPARTVYDVFLSHNSKDKDAVRAIAEALRAAGVKCWYDEWNLVPGEPWQKALTQGLEESRVCAVFFGESGLGPWHDLEQQLALTFGAGGKRGYGIIPVRLPYAPEWSRLDVPPFLRLYHGVEFRAVSDGAALARLAAGIKGAAPPAAAVTAQEGTPPYVGMRALGRDEQGQFFGRDRYVLDLLERMRATAAPRLTFVLGSSGSGKSSLLAAGLLPRLEAGDIGGSADWLCTVLKPGQDAWVSLRAGLRKLPAFAPHVDLTPARAESWLHEVATAAAGDDAGTAHPRRVVLVVDQFEEVFTARPASGGGEYDEKSLRPFLTNLLYAASDPAGPVTVIFSLRRDFFKAVEDDPLLQEAAKDRSRRLIVDAMNEGELRCAIERPALTRGVTFEPGLVTALCEDFRMQPAGSLPFLQAALLRMWTGRDAGGPMLNRTYEQMGRLRGAVNDHAQKVFANLPEDEQKLARPLFLHLVRLSDDGGQDTKRRMPLTDLPGGEPAVRTARRLADGEMRLLTIDSDESGSRAPTVEIAHEALLTGWEDLRKWIEDSRSERLKLRTVEAQVRQSAAEHKPGFVPLLHVSDLRSAKHAAKKLPEEVPPSVQKSIDHSVRARRFFWAKAAGIAIAILAAAGAGGKMWYDHQQDLEKLADEEREQEDRKRELVLNLIDQSINTRDRRLSYLLAREAVARAVDPAQRAKALHAVRQASLNLGGEPLQAAFYFGENIPSGFSLQAVLDEFAGRLISVEVAGKKLSLTGFTFYGQKGSSSRRTLLHTTPWIAGLQARCEANGIGLQFNLSEAAPAQTLSVPDVPAGASPVFDTQGRMAAFMKGNELVIPGRGEPIPLGNEFEPDQPVGADFSPDGAWVLTGWSVYAAKTAGPAVFTVPADAAFYFFTKDGKHLAWLKKVYPGRPLIPPAKEDPKQPHGYELYLAPPGGGAAERMEGCCADAKEVLRKAWHLLPDLIRDTFCREARVSLAGPWLASVATEKAAPPPEKTDAGTDGGGASVVQKLVIENLENPAGAVPPVPLSWEEGDFWDSRYDEVLPARSADGRLLALPGENQCRVLDLQSPGPPEPPRVVDKNVQSASLSPNGDWLCIRTETSTLLFNRRDPANSHSALQLPGAKSNPVFSDDGRWLRLEMGSPKDPGRDSETEIGLFSLDESLILKRRVSGFKPEEKLQYLGKGNEPAWTPAKEAADMETALKVFTAEALLRSIRLAPDSGTGEATPPKPAAPELVRRATELLAEAKTANPTLRFSTPLVVRSLLARALGFDAYGSYFDQTGDWQLPPQVLALAQEHGIDPRVPAGALEERAVAMHLRMVLDYSAANGGGGIAEKNKTWETRMGALNFLTKYDPEFVARIKPECDVIECYARWNKLFERSWSPEAGKEVRELDEKLHGPPPAPGQPPPRGLVHRRHIPSAPDSALMLMRMIVWQLNSASDDTSAKEAIALMNRALELLPAGPWITPVLRLPAGKNRLTFDVGSAYDYTPAGPMTRESSAFVSQKILSMYWLGVRRHMEKDVERFGELAWQADPNSTAALARAVTLARRGKFDEAAALVESFNQANGDSNPAAPARETEEWMATLRKGQDPFTDEVVQALAAQ